MGTPQLGLPGVETVRVSEIMVTPVRTVPPNLSVAGFIRILLTEQITGAPVVADDGHLMGVVSSSDVMRTLLTEDEVASGDTMMDPDPTGGRGPAEDPQELLLGYFQSREPTATLLSLAAGAGTILTDLTVADIMTPAAFTIAPDATVRELAAFLTRGRIHRSLVVDHGALRGIVTSSDVVRLIAGDSEEEGEP